VNAGIDTLRTWLRPVVPADAEFLVALERESGVEAFLGGTTDVTTKRARLIEKQAEWQVRRWGMFLVVDRMVGEPIGVSGFVASQTECAGEPELMCALVETVRRDYLGLEVCEAVIKWALYDRKFARVVAAVSHANRPAMGLVHKLGMVHKGFRPFTRGGIEEVFTLKAKCPVA
jgi:RimJ/RimL family protein N-acetyltransferase